MFVFFSALSLFGEEAERILALTLESVIGAYCPSPSIENILA